jgi:hypothetical protein
MPLSEITCNHPSRRRMNSGDERGQNPHTPRVRRVSLLEPPTPHRASKREIADFGRMRQTGLLLPRFRLEGRT